MCFEGLRTRFRRPAIDVVACRDGRMLILNGAVAVVDSAGQPNCRLSTTEYPDLLRDRFETLAAQEPAEVVECGVAVLIADAFTSPNLCHFLLDQTTRLWLYEQAGIDPASVTVVGPRLHSDYQQTIISRLGITSYVDVERRMEIRARHIGVSTNCRELHHAADRGAAWAIGYLRDRFNPPEAGADCRLYVSRRNAAGRRVCNEDAVENLLRRHGFITMRPEELPFDEQVRRFAGATPIVAPHGAGLTNAIFARPGVHVLEMFHPLYGTASYAGLAQEAGWSYAALVGRDWESRAPAFNDPSVAGYHQGQFGSRDMDVDLQAMVAWMATAGCSVGGFEGVGGNGG